MAPVFASMAVSVAANWAAVKAASSPVFVLAAELETQARLLAQSSLHGSHALVG